MHPIMDPVYLMPYVKNVGEEVFLSCESLMPSDEIFWEKENGSLPADSSTDHGVLRIPYLTKEDEGTYKCVAKQGDLETEFEVRLQVDDFVPVFFGSDSMEFSPLEDDQLKNLEIELTVNPAASDGVLFFTERRGEVDVAAEESDRRPPVIQHIARLEDGHLIYEYDVGHGRDELVHPVDVPLNEWTTVQVRNDDRAASLQVNNGLPVVKEHPEQIILKGENQPLILGKQPPDEEARRPLPGLKGVVSEVIVSGTPVPIVNGTASPGIRRFDTCRAKPCANGGRCRVANRIRGYTCVCQEQFGGYQCETLSSKCKNEHCNGGICINENDTWQCVCPLNSTGLRCEKVVHSPPRKSFAFLNHTSFLAVRSPPLLDQMKISLRLRPNQLTGERVLLYAASEHGESPPAFMSLEVRDRHVVFAQQHGQERQEVKSAEIADTESLGAVDVLLLRDNHGISLVLNGQNSSEKNVVSSFSPVTDLFIGGFPPAFKAPLSVSHNAFQGCIEEMTINSREVDLASWSQYSSGDVVSCDSLGEEITAIPSIGVKEEGEIENGTLTEGPTESIEPTKIFPTTTSSTSSTTTTTPSPPVTSEEREIEEEPEEVEETTTTTPAAITTSSTTTTEETEHFYLTEKDKEAPPEVIPTVSAETVEEEECTGVGCVENVTAVTDVCEENDCGPNGRCEAFNSSHYLCVCNLFYDGPRCGIFKPIEHAAHFNGDAFIEISADELPHITSEKEERLHLRFKTTSDNGLLLWQGQQPEVPIAGEDYFSLAITNGYLHYSYELGGGAAHLVSPIRVNDGKEHVVRLERRGRTGSMYLDDLPEIRGVSSGILAMLNVDGNIFIGGVPLISHNTGGLHEHNFIGCVADVQMNGQRLDLMGTAIDGKNVRPCEEWLEQKKFIKKRRRT